MKCNKKMCKFGKIIFTGVGFLVIISGIMCWLKCKFGKKNIDCDEYNENLESLKDKQIEIDLYIDEKKDDSKNNAESEAEKKEEISETDL